MAMGICIRMGGAQGQPAGTGRNGAFSDNAVLVGQPTVPCVSDDMLIVDVAPTLQQPDQRINQAGGSNRSNLAVQFSAEIEELHQHVRQMQPLFPGAACPAEGMPAKSKVTTLPSVHICTLLRGP